MALINVYKLMVDTLIFSGRRLPKPDNAQLENPVTSTGVAPDSWGRRLMQYLTGGTLQADFREDMGSMKAGLQLFALDMKNGEISSVFSPMMSTLMAVVPTALVEYQQPDRPVEIDCEDAVQPGENGIAPFVLHPNGPYYCESNDEGINPVVLTCEYALSKGALLGVDGAGNVCFTDDKFVSVIHPVGGIPNPAPLVAESIPAPTPAVTPSSSNGNLNGEQKGFSLDNLTPHERRALAAAGIALVLGAGMLLSAFLRNLIPQKSEGGGRVSVSWDGDEKQSDPTVTSRPRKEWNPYAPKKIKPIDPKFLDDMERRWGNIITLLNKILPNEGGKEDKNES